MRDGRVVLAVIAKSPQAGRSKTRLCPPCTPEQAAALAMAALQDTLAAVQATPAHRRILVLDGEGGDWIPDAFEVIGQRGDGLGERLGAAFTDIGEPTLVVGMDTPQLTPGLLSEGTSALAAGVSAVLGLAEDGGYWAIGLRSADPGLFAGISMSEDDTGAQQLERLRERGHTPALLTSLHDVDDFADALAVAPLAPASRFAAAMRPLRSLRAAAA